MDKSAIKRHLFLTGDKQVGKSTLLRNLIKAANLDYAGFETRPFFINGERRGFTLHGHIDMPPYENDCVISVRCAQRLSVPVIPVFEQNGVSILCGSIDSNAEFILMDELGKLECGAPSFINQVFACLDSDKRIIGVLQKCAAQHLDQIKNRADVTVISVTPENRDQLFEQLLYAYKAK